MSDDLYASRLRFSGWSGCAKLHGRSVSLSRCPQLPGIESVFVAVDYIPEVGMVRIQPLASAWRDMWPEEIAAADALLRDLVGA